jgi:hypothetical protein
MNRARLVAIGKLLLLVGLPSTLVLGLFGAGVHCGVTHRASITRFERDVMGLDVEVPEPPKSETPTLFGVRWPSSTASATSVPPTTTTAPATTPPASTPPATTTPPTTTPPATTPATTTPTTTTPPPETTTPPAVTTTVDPLSGDLAARFAMPVKVRIKVVVDDEMIASRPDWIDYVQRTVASASQIYQQQFGIELVLTGVARWPVTTAGMSADQLLGELRTRTREGSDILVGMTARPLDGSISGEAETPLPTSDFNGAFGIVYAVPRAREPHLRTLLHEVAHMFGALDITDADDPAWRAGSWMSYAPVPDGTTPWIDVDNRTRILGRKDKPFAPEGAPMLLAPEPTAPAVPEADDNPTL